MLVITMQANKFTENIKFDKRSNMMYCKKYIATKHEIQIVTL